MNHIFRSIWSEALSTWVAVSELTSSKGKSRSCVLNAAELAENDSESGNIAKSNSRLRIKPLVLTLACCFSLNAQANPVGGQVVSGSASINQSGNLLTVTNSPNAIINWQGFSIGSGETTRFIQQSSSSSILNRVIGADPSSLLGTLTSNGRVFLINPAGILVGQGARINVQGFVASTLNLSNADFLAGNLNFKNPSPPGGGAGEGVSSVINKGTITTPEGGSVYLVAPQVENQGIINTPKGETLLAAGNTVQLVDTGTPGVSVQITGSNNTATNLGQILADSGRIGMVGAVVNNSGTISANSLVSQGGKVFLKATNSVEAGGTISAEGATGGGNISVLADKQSGRVNVTGELDASAPNIGNGGFIETSAASVKVADNALVTTLATNGRSGTWLIDPYDFTIAQTNGDINGISLNYYLTFGSVVISTTTTGTNSLTNLYGTAGVNGDILVNDVVSWATPFSLTLSAAHNISITASITGTNASSNLVLNASGTITNNSGAGLISVTSLQTTSVGGTSLTGANAVGSFNATNTGGGNITLTNASTTLTVTGISNTGGGAVNIDNTGSISTSSTPITADGSIDLLATGDITVNALANITGGSDVSLIAGWDGVSSVATPVLTLGTGNITSYANIMSSGNLSLFAGGNIALNAGTPTGTIQITHTGNWGTFTNTYSGTYGSGGNIEMLAGGTFNLNYTGLAVGGSGSITIMAGWDGISTTTPAITSYTPSKNITLNGGGIGSPGAGYVTLAAADTINISANSTSAGIDMDSGTLNMSADRIILTASSTDALGQNMSANIFSNGDQYIDVGFAGDGGVGVLSLMGGGLVGYSGQASIYRFGTTTGGQNFTFNNGSSLVLHGGNGSGLAPGGYFTTGNCDGHFGVYCSGNSANIDNQATGGQFFTFVAGTNANNLPIIGNLTLTGGSGGNNNFAEINNSVTGVQTIAGNPVITLTGGNSGGAMYYNDGTDPNNNYLNPKDQYLTNDAGISSNVSQSIHAASITLNGGGAAFGSAYLSSQSQTIFTNGDIVLNGGTAAAPTAFTASGKFIHTDAAFIGNDVSATPSITVGGNLILNGGLVSSYGGSAAGIGSLFGTANVTINTTGYVSLSSANPLADRIGSIAGAGGSVGITSNAANAGIGTELGYGLVGTGTSGSVTLDAVGGSIDGVNSIITTATLSTSAIGGITLTNANNTISSFSANNSGGGIISLNNSGTLNISGINQVGGGAVTINNAGSITTTGLIAADGNINLFATGNVADDVIISNGINFTGTVSAGTLSVEANRNVVVQTNPIQATGTQALNVIINSDRNADSSGAAAILLGGNILSNGGNITIGGGSGTISAGSGFAFGNGTTSGSTVLNSGIYVQGNITAGVGNVTMNGQSALGDGITLAGGTLSSNGLVTLAGVTSAAGASSTAIVAGVNFSNTGTRLTTATGTVNVNGSSNSSGAYSQGILVDSATTETTGTGSLTFNGTSSGYNGSWSMGIINGGTVQTTASNGGMLSLTGTSTRDGGIVIGYPGYGNGIGSVLSNGGEIRMKVSSALDSILLGGTATIGGNNSGNILLQSTSATNVTLNAGSVVNAGANALTISMSGGTASEVAGVITSGSLRLLGTGTFNLGSVSNNVGTLAASLTGVVNYYGTSGFTIGSITSFDGISSTVSPGITTNNGNFTAVANNGLTPGNITLNPGSTINVGSGALNLAATGGNLNVSGTVTAGIFTLSGGTWNQIGATLPSFTVTDFRIAGGTFIRALGGNGSTATPYQLADIYGVQGIGSAGMMGNSYILADNIDASGTLNWNGGSGFAPIGNVTPFTGSFDGLGHTISNLTISRSGTSQVGLFSVTASGSGISNIGLSGGSVTGNQYVGGLVGYNGGSVSNSYTTENVSGTLYYVGGLVGWNNGIVSGSYSTGSVTGGGNSVGGLVGYNHDTVTNSYAIGRVSGSVYAAYCVGGLVGNSVGTISNSYSTGNVSGVSYAIGGLVGQNNGTINNSYATGSALSTSSGQVGGLVGYNGGTINTSYATGSVSGNFQVGGLVGYNYNYGFPGVINNSFWDTVTTHQIHGADGSIGVADSFGLTNAQMMTMSRFTGWNIANTGGTTSVWRIYEGHTTPLLASFLTPLALGAPDTTATYNGASQSGGAFTLIANVLGSAATGTHAGFYNGYYSNQQGYDISGGNLTITPETLTATLTNIGVTKTYDGTLSVPAGFTPSFNITGYVPGDSGATALLNYTGTAYTSAHVATVSNTVVVSGLTIGSFSGGVGSVSDYTLNGVTSINIGATITAAPLTASATIVPVSKTYDGTLAAVGSSVSSSIVSGLIGGDTMTLNTSGVSLNFNDAHVATSTKTISATGSVTLGTLTSSGSGDFSGSSTSNLVASQATDYALPAQPIIASVVGTITTKQLTVAAASIGGTLTKFYDGTALAPGATLTGGAVSNGLIGETITLTGIALNYNSSHVVSATTISASGTAGLNISGGTAGSQASDYSFTPPTINSVSGGISPLSVTWVSGNWSTISNWVGSILPVTGDVQSVTIPSSNSMTYDVSGFSLPSINIVGSMVLTPGSSLSIGSYAQTGGNLSGGGSLTVTSSFSQAATATIALTGTAIANITQTSGNLAIVNLAAPTVNLTATAGAITQSGPISATLLTSRSVGGTSLNNANTVAGFNAINTGGGNIELTNASSPLTITGISNSGGGSVTVTSTGAISITGAIAAGGGAVNLTETAGAITESGSGLINTTGLLTTSSVTGETLTGANAVGSFNATNSATGNIALTNTSSPLAITGISNSVGDILVNNTGATITTSLSSVSTSSGAVTIVAHSPLTINGTISATGNITLTAGATGGSTDTLTLNGLVSSATGNVSLSAGNAIVESIIPSAPMGVINLQSDLNAPPTSVQQLITTVLPPSNNPSGTSIISSITNNVLLGGTPDTGLLYLLYYSAPSIGGIVGTFGGSDFSTLTTTENGQAVSTELQGSGTGTSGSGGGVDNSKGKPNAKPNKC